MDLSRIIMLPTPNQIVSNEYHMNRIPVLHRFDESLTDVVLLCTVEAMWTQKNWRLRHNSEICVCVWIYRLTNVVARAGKQFVIEFQSCVFELYGMLHSNWNNNWIVFKHNCDISTFAHLIFPHAIFSHLMRNWQVTLIIAFSREYSYSWWNVQNMNMMIIFAIVPKALVMLSGIFMMPLFHLRRMIIYTITFSVRVWCPALVTDCIHTAAWNAKLFPTFCCRHESIKSSTRECSRTFGNNKLLSKWSHTLNECAPSSIFELCFAEWLIIHVLYM